MILPNHPVRKKLPDNKKRAHPNRSFAGDQPSSHRQSPSPIVTIIRAMADSPSASSHATAHAYASNGLEVLQAATDAAAAAVQHALENAAAQHALENAAAAAGLESVVNANNAHDDQDAQLLASASVSAQPVPVAYPMVPAPSGPPPPGAGTGGNGNTIRDPTINPKLTRLRRACDLCSQRKVKCDEAGPPCKPCRDLNVECTFNRELKRRGPPNKHAEAARQARKPRIEPSSGGPVLMSASIPYGPGITPTPSPHNAAQTLVSIATHEGMARLDAESIAPWPVLELLVDDFFTYIHPLAPFPHEPTFRASFMNREDRTNPEFLGLLAAMIGALVASFPRSARQHLKSQHTAHLFPRSIVMIEKCQDIALETRGPKWHKKQPKTLEDCETSYLLGLAAAYTLQWDVAREYMSETLMLIRFLGFNPPKHPGMLPTFGNDNCSPDPLPFNHVKDQIGKRLFWTILLGVRYVFSFNPFNIWAF
jgi:hypothetical protein